MPTTSPGELSGRVGTAEMFTATPEVNLGDAAPDVTLPVALTGTVTSYDWGINGTPPIPARHR